MSLEPVIKTRRPVFVTSGGRSGVIDATGIDAKGASADGARIWAIEAYNRAVLVPYESIHPVVWLTMSFPASLVSLGGL
jgi:hypothetical protein